MPDTRTAGVASAYQKRIGSNKAEADRLAAINSNITKDKENEIDRFTARIERLGPTICGGPAAPSKHQALPAATAPIHPAGWFEKTLTEILKR